MPKFKDGNNVKYYFTVDIVKNKNFRQILLLLTKLLLLMFKFVHYLRGIPRINKTKRLEQLQECSESESNSYGWIHP